MLLRGGRLLSTAGIFFLLAVGAPTLIWLGLPSFITKFPDKHYTFNTPTADFPSNSGEDLPSSSAASISDTIATSPVSPDTEYDNHGPPFFAVDHKETHVELFSKTTANGEWFPIIFGDHAAYNPNIIPHPDKSDTWFIVAQRDKSKDDDIVWFTELVCEASFREGALRCNKQPLILPIASTVSTQCDGRLEFFNLTMGPHDARVFLGPDQPLIIYGSQSQYGCFGLWIHDFRRLVAWTTVPDTKEFFWPTDVPRPLGQSQQLVEKNWFPFWDSNGDMYMHYDIYPTRSFAKIDVESNDSLVGEDIAPLAAKHDTACMDKYMPRIHDGWRKEYESIHQSTNSLAITLCKRSDPSCVKSDENTYNFIIYQFKSFYYHGAFEPYVMLFKQTAPFDIHGMSTKPFWYHGRGEAGGSWRGLNTWIPKNSSQMVYTTSMSWKEKGLTYHGYLDDELFIGFGVEDKESYGIDITAGDLIAGLGLCE